MKILDLNQWNRKDHFEFFSKYDNPFFGIVTEIDCTLAYDYTKKNGISFFAYYLYKSITAINKIDELKLRVVNKKVVMFDEIHASSTIGRDDGTFGFSFIKYSSDSMNFYNDLKEEIRRVQRTRGLNINENDIRADVVHYSTLPWNKFTGLSHARNFNSDDTVPKITFGKIFTVQDKKMMPIAIDAHHGLADGFHIAKYLEEFQRLMNGE